MTGQEMPYDQAARTVRYCVCSVCWGELQEDKVSNTVSFVHCKNKNCSGSTFVSKRYVEQRRQESYLERQEVRRTYGAIFEIDKPISVEQALHDLGF